MVTDYLLIRKRKIFPELQKTFDAEIQFLKRLVGKEMIILDVGCGSGRPAIDLSTFVKKIVGVDTEKKLITLAKIYAKNKKNVKFKRQNALDLKFPDNTFDITYSTFSTIGAIACREGKIPFINPGNIFELRKKQAFRHIKEMVRVTRKGGKIVTITWNNKKSTTIFLDNFYVKRGLKIIKINNFGTIASLGKSWWSHPRPPKRELLDYYQMAKLKKIKFYEIKPLWKAIVGTKK